MTFITLYFDFEVARKVQYPIMMGGLNMNSTGYIIDMGHCTLEIDTILSPRELVTTRINNRYSPPLGLAM